MGTLRASRPRANPERKLRGESVVVVAVAVAVWEAVVRLGLTPSVFAPPLSVARALIDDVQNDFLWSSIGTTLTAWAIGLVIAVAVGVPVGLLLGRSRLLSRMFAPSLEFVRTIPSVAALPLLILLYGSGTRLAATMVVLGAVWPLIISSMYGARDVDPLRMEMAHAFGVGRARRFLRVVLPSSLPYLATGLRISATMGMILAISASLIAGGDGLGAAIRSASDSGAVPLLYGRVLMAGFIGLGVAVLLARSERRLLRWHQSLSSDRG